LKNKEQQYIIGQLKNGVQDINDLIYETTTLPIDPIRKILIKMMSDLSYYNNLSTIKEKMFKKDGN